MRKEFLDDNNSFVKFSKAYFIACIKHLPCYSSAAETASQREVDEGLLETLSMDDPDALLDLLAMSTLEIELSKSICSICITKFDLKFGVQIRKLMHTHPDLHYVKEFIVLGLEMCCSMYLFNDKALIPRNQERQFPETIISQLFH